MDEQQRKLHVCAAFYSAAVTAAGTISGAAAARVARATAARRCVRSSIIAMSISTGFYACRVCLSSLITPTWCESWRALRLGFSLALVLGSDIWRRILGESEHACCYHGTVRAREHQFHGAIHSRARLRRRC